MSFFTRFINLFRRRSLERELDAELRFHLDRRIDLNVRQGMTQADAEVEAYQRFGSLSAAKRRMQEVRTMKAPVAVAAVAGLLVCLAAGAWFWMRNGEPSRPRRYYQTTDIGITRPTVVHERRPEYPPEAMQAKIQGAVFMKCIVQTNGVCGDIQVAKSLDPMWLDLEAVKALEQWRFQPGTLGGEAVPVMVDIEFRFAVRKD